MNTPNNKRKKESQKKIQKVFIELIQTKEINEITISDICKKANLNRTTFYSNYIDIYDLADKIKEDLFQEVLKLYPTETQTKKHSYDFLKLFNHIKENQLFYKTYFKLNYENDFDVLEGMIDYGEVEKYLGNKENITPVLLKLNPYRQMKWKLGVWKMDSLKLFQKVSST